MLDFTLKIIYMKNSSFLIIHSAFYLYFENNFSIKKIHQKPD